MIIEIKNLTKAQELAIESMFAKWLGCGGVGHSEFVAFYADGDGDFHPEIIVDGKKPEHYKMSDGKFFGRKKDSTTWLDYDAIAWDLRKRKED